MKPTETTTALIKALRDARGIDLDKLFASALDVAVTNYTTGAATVERISIPAEFAGPLVAGLIDALEKTIERRIDSIAQDLAQARAVLGKP